MPDPIEEAEPGFLEDMFRVAAPLVVPQLYEPGEAVSQVGDSGSRILRRIREGAPGAVEHPLDTLGDALTGAAQFSGIGSIVERLGTPREHTARSTVEEALVPGLGFGRDLYDDGPGREEALGEGFDQLHARQREAEARSPVAYGLGQAGGAIAPALAPVSEAPAAGAAVAERVAPLISPATRALTEAGLFSALTSEGTNPSEVLEDTGTGVAIAAPIVGAAQIPRIARDRYLSRASQELRDHRRVAAPGGARALGAQDAAQWDSLPGGIPEQARRMREMGLPGLFDTPADISERARTAADTALGRSEGIRTDFDAAGGGVPIEDIYRTLDGVAERADVEPVLRRMGLPDDLRGMRDEFVQQVGPSPTRVVPRVRGEARAAMEARLADLLANPPDLGVPPGIAQAQEGLARAERREAELAASGDRGALERRASRARPPEGRTVDELVEMLGGGPERPPEALSLDDLVGPPVDRMAGTRPRRGATPRPVVDEGSLSRIGPEEGAAREAESEALWHSLGEGDVRTSPVTDPGIAADAEEAAASGRSVDPRRSASAREAHARRVEADELVEHDMDESLVPVWRRLSPRERAAFQRTPHSSRAEAFEAWAHDHSADVQRMQVEAQEAGVDRMRPPVPDDVTMSRRTRDGVQRPPPSSDEGLAGYGPDVEEVLRGLDEAPAPAAGPPEVTGRPTAADEMFGPQPRTPEEMDARLADIDRRAEAGDIRQDLGRQQLAVPLADLEAQIRRLQAQTGYVTPLGARMPAGDEMHALQASGLRDLSDRLVAETLPEGSAAADLFRDSRLDTQTAMQARTQAQRAVARSAGHSIFGGVNSHAATAAGAALAGPAGGLAGRLTHAVTAPRLPAIRTVTEDAIASMLRSPRTAALGRVLQRLERAGRLDAVHEMLSREEPGHHDEEPAGSAPAPADRAGRGEALRRRARAAALRERARARSGASQ